MYSNRFPKLNRRQFAAWLSIAVLCFTMLPMPKASADTSTGAKLSFTFDDGLSSALNQAAPVLQKYGYTGTDYIITHCVGLLAGAANNDCAAAVDRNYMTWSEVAQLQNSFGWEIGSHTINHPLTAAADNKTLTDAQLDNEMSGSKLALKAQGFDASDFASPYGDYDNRSIAAAAKYYASHRTFQDLTQPTDPNDLVTNTFPYYAPRSSYPYNNYLLTVMEVQGNVPPETVEAAIQQAQANNQWLILVFHEIKADNDPTYSAALDDYQYRAGDLDKVAAFAKSVNMPVTDIAHGLASGTNLLPNSGFNDGIADGWTTDATTKIVADKQSTSLAGHGSYDGTDLGPLNSIFITGSTTDTHLFSPKVTVIPGTTYTLTNFVNVTSTSGEIDFFVDEYDANGTYVGGKYVPGVIATTAANDVQVGDVNFTYTPSSASVASARLQVIAHGSGTRAYVDNLQWLSPNGATTPPPVITPPNPGKVGDVNGDGTINALDLSTVLANWNKTGQTKAQGDLNADGTVNALDLSTVLSNWSK